MIPLIKLLCVPLLCVFSAVAQSPSRLVTMGIPTDGIVPPSPDATEDVRLVSVYLPEGYDDNDERYPVVYFLPGFGGTNTANAASSKIILDALISQKRSVPMIVVYNDSTLPNPDPASKCQRRYVSCWYTNSALNGLFEDFITKNTVQFIDSHFRTKADKAFRGIMGHSQGGYGTEHLGIKHPELFAGFAAASATSFYTIATTDLASPGNPLYTLNSFIQPEIPTEGPFAGKIFPRDNSQTEQVFSYSAALSPNLDAVKGIPVNPFVDEFCVDLPVFVNGDGTPVFAPGPATGADTVPPGAPLVFQNTLVMNPEVIERWREKDPYFVMDDFIETMKEQCIYLDGGTDELMLAVGARILSEKLAANGINHEYLLFNGGHVTCLTDILCSRFSAMFQYFSTKFAEAGICPDKVRTSLIGTGQLILEDTAQMIIDKNSWLALETAPALNVTETAVTVELNDSAQVNIGTDTTLGGGLQIGNSFSKALIFGNPSLGTHTIQGIIIINGPDARLRVGRQGFLGLGAGVAGKSPDIPNKWSISSLTNVTNIVLDIRQGVLQHNRIFSGQEPTASVLAIGPSKSYTIKVNPELAVIRGGGNVVCLPDGWRRHPLVLDRPGQIQPETVPECFQFTCDVRRNLNDSTDINDYFYKQNMASTGFYTLPSTANMLKSSEQLDDRVDGANPFELIDATSLDTVCAFLRADNYQDEASKEGAIALHDDGLRIGYVDIKNPTSSPASPSLVSSGDCGCMNEEDAQNPAVIDTVTRFVRTSAIPLGCKQKIDFDKILKTGTIGIWVEEVDGERELIRVYDLKPAKK